jgi:predicted amidophosphoribosyltransferase
MRKGGRKMAYFNVCPDCGSNLDPGEKCDCKKEAVKQQEFYSRYLRTEPKVGQLAFAFDGKGVGYASKNFI